MTVPHAALAPSGQPIWTQLARDSATASYEMVQRGDTLRDILTRDAIFNAMLIHAAVGGSTNLLLHIPAIAAAATVEIVMLPLIWLPVIFTAKSIARLGSHWASGVLGSENSTKSRVTAATRSQALPLRKGWNWARMRPG